MQFEINNTDYIYDASLNLIKDKSNNIVNLSQHSDKKNKYYKTVFLELTNKCNLNCNYCYLKDITSNSIKIKASLQPMLALLSKFIDKYKYLMIVFYGGEPLLCFDLIKEITSFCDNRMLSTSCGIVYSITTNGTLLNDDIIKVLIDKKFSISLSLDGTQETMLINRGVNNPNKIVSYIYHLSEHCLDITLISTLFSKSIKNIKTDFEYLLKLPVKQIKFLPCDSVCGKLLLTHDEAMFFVDAYKNTINNLVLKKDYNSIIKLYDVMHLISKIANQEQKQPYCGIGNDVFCISARSKIYTCPCFLDNSDFEIDNINCYHTSNKDSYSKCNHCISLSLCNGNCEYTRYLDKINSNSLLKIRCFIMRELTKLALITYTNLYS